MKKALTLILALALLLTALPMGAAAADPKGDAMRAYADIVAKAASYDFGLSPYAQLDSRSYQYAIADLKDGNGVPTLLLCLCASGYDGSFEYVRMFCYDAGSGTVLAPEKCVTGGVAGAGGFRGSLGICNGRLACTEWAAMTGWTTISEYTIVGGELWSNILWSGMMDQVPSKYRLDAIDWKATWDTAPFDAYQNPAPSGPSVVRSPQNLRVNGTPVACEKYNIDGSNYFKLRDLAQLLNGTGSQFDVGWDGVKGVVSITTSHAYTTPNGTELVVGADRSATAQVSAQTIMINGTVRSDLTVYNIGGSNFFKLRELGDALGFAVDYDAATNTAIVKSTGGDTPAPSAAWPKGPVTIYSGTQIGSLADVNLRTIADWIMTETGVEVTIECNDTDAGATLALKLTQAAPDGQTLMAVGMSSISSYYNGTWQVNPADSTKFKIAAGAIQPYPDSGCILLTQADAPYSTWNELAAYAAAHPGKITVASIPGKVMDFRMKALFNGTGVAKNIRWAPSKSAEATAALLGGNINCVMLDETTAVQYIQFGDCKAIINCRADEDFSYYPAEQQDTIVSVIKDVPTLADVFGADAAKYMVPNRSVLVVPAGTPDAICDAIAEVIGRLDAEPEGSQFYDRCRINGGTSKYYAWPGDQVMAEWARLSPVIKEIVEMG